MKPAEIHISFDKKTPYYKQIIDHISRQIRDGLLKPGVILPSLNLLSQQLDISPETVKKAYTLLRQKGLLESTHGIGFYVAEQKKSTLRILLLLDKLNTYKEVLYHSFSSELGDKARITIRLHNQDIDLFEQFIEENKTRYDYYLVTPHFPLDTATQKRVTKALRKIPNRKLILADRLITELPGNFGSVYQDFEPDAYQGMVQCADRLKKYRRLNLLAMPGSLYAPFIQKGVKKFCTEHNIPLAIHTRLDAGIVRKKEAFLVVNSQVEGELIQLVGHARKQGLTIGRDIGILSYNESPINEIILDGLSVLSTDFVEMGRVAAEMIRSGEMSKQKCSFNFIRRQSF